MSDPLTDGINRQVLAEMKFQRDKPETPSELAPAACSVSPDCCAKWTRSGEHAEWSARMECRNDVPKPEMHFLYCPWCGRARQNDKAEPKTQ